MLSLPGPTPIHSIGTFRYSSMKLIYFLQFSGNSPYDDAAPIDLFQPGKVTYDTSTNFSFSKSATEQPDEHYDRVLQKLVIGTNRGNQQVPFHQRGISQRP
jgi:hypothetical protein